MNSACPCGSSPKPKTRAAGHHAEYKLVQRAGCFAVDILGCGYGGVRYGSCYELMNHNMLVFLFSALCWQLGSIRSYGDAVAAAGLRLLFVSCE